MVVITIAGKPVNFGNLAQALPKTPIGPTETPIGFSSPIPEVVSSGKSTADILRNQFRIIQENAVNPVKLSGNLQLAERNLIKLGESSVQISESLNTFAEQQGDINTGLVNTVDEINTRVSGQLIDLGKSLSELSGAVSGKSITDPLAKAGEFFTGQTFGVPNALLLGGLVIGVLILK